MNFAEEERKESMTSTPQRSSLDDDTSAMAAMYRSTPAHSDQHRIVELEHENSRLHRLVAELLLKNQQLRKPE
jgi:hypothetical protein